MYTHILKATTRSNIPEKGYQDDNRGLSKNLNFIKKWHLLN